MLQLLTKKGVIVIKWLINQNHGFLIHSAIIASIF